MDLRMAAFYTDWSCYRKSLGQYSINNLGPCNIAIYSFAIMEPGTFKIIPADPNAASEQYKGFVEHCENNGKLPLLALGGWVDSAGDKYSIMLNNPDHRKTFIKNTIEYLKENGFRGLNIDIEYPTCPQHDLVNGNPNDKDGFTKLLEEMRPEFNKYKFDLSVCIPGSTDVIDRAYDLKVLCDNLHWIGVMTYDYHVSSGRKTGPISSITDTKKTISHLIERGADKNKLVIGIPFYGHRYNLRPETAPEYGAESLGSGPPGPYTREQGYLAYYEIYNLINKNEYKFVCDNDCSYAFKQSGESTDFISYNSESDIQNKIDLVKENNLGGVMIWEASMDDFTGKFCDKGTNPLLNLIRKQL